MGTSDEALLAGLANGDREAAAAFVRRFQKRVYGLALGIVGDAGTAEDVAQEAFTRAWRRADGYDARRGRVLTWLLTITRSTAIDVVRLRRAQPMDPELLTARLQLEQDGGATRVDRSLADHYRSVLAEAHGSYFSAARLRDAAGAEGGTVFLYQGAPSWLVITVSQPYVRSVDRAEIETRDGRRLPLVWFGLDEGTWGGAVPVALDAVSHLRLLDREGRVVLETQAPAQGD